MFEKHKQIKKRLTEITTPMLYLIIYLYDVLKDSYYIITSFIKKAKFKESRSSKILREFYHIEFS
jgi:hypothetical protein